MKAVREAIQKANLLTDQFAGRRFRIGVATTAATLGLEDSLIKMLG